MRTYAQWLKRDVSTMLGMPAEAGMVLKFSTLDWEKIQPYLTEFSHLLISPIPDDHPLEASQEGTAYLTLNMDWNNPGLDLAAGLPDLSSDEADLNGLVVQDLVMVETEPRQGAFSPENLNKMPDEIPRAIAQNLGLDWNTVLEVMGGNPTIESGNFIKQKLLEGWRPEHGRPEIKVSWEGDIPVIECWNYNLAVAVAQTEGVGLRWNVGDVFKWVKPWQDETQRKSSWNYHKLYTEATSFDKEYKRVQRYCQLKNKPTPSPRDFFSIGGTYESYMSSLGLSMGDDPKDKIELFEEFFSKGIVKNPPSLSDERGGVNLRSTPYGEHETAEGYNNVIRRLRFNETFQVLRRLPTDGWYYILTNDGVYGYVAIHYVEVDLPDPGAFYHIIGDGETAMTIASTYLSRIPINKAIEFLVKVNNGDGINAPRLANGEVDWKLATTVKGAMIWIPGKGKLFSELQSASQNVLTKVKYIEQGNAEKVSYDSRIPLTEEENALFLRIKSQIDNLPPGLVQEFNSQIGKSWRIILPLIPPLTQMTGEEFYSTFIPMVAGTVMNFNTPKLIELNERLSEHRLSVQILLQAMYFLHRFAVSAAFELLDRSESIVDFTIAQLQTESGLNELYQKIQSMKGDFENADRIRAEGIKKLYGNRTLIPGNSELSLAGATGDVDIIAKVLQNRKSSEVLSDLEADFPPLPPRPYVNQEKERKVHAQLAFTLTPEFKKAKDVELTASKKNPGKFSILLDSEINWKDCSMLSKEQLKLYLLSMLKRKQENIISARQQIADDPGLVWKLPYVIKYALQQRGMMPESGSYQIFYDAVLDFQEGWFWKFVFGIGLAVAGYYTFGASWAGLAVTSAGLAFNIDAFNESWEEYQLHHSANDTGIGEVIALSKEDPSFFWVALAFFGMMFDAGLLLYSVNRFSQLLKAAKITGRVTKADFEAAFDELVKAGELSGVSKEEWVNKMMQFWEKNTKTPEDAFAFLKLLKSLGLDSTDPILSLGWVRFLDECPEAQSILRRFLKDPEVLNAIAKMVLRNRDFSAAAAKLLRMMGEEGEVISEATAKILSAWASRGKMDFASLNETLDWLENLMRGNARLGQSDIITRRKLMEDFLSDWNPDQLRTDKGVVARPGNRYAIFNYVDPETLAPARYRSHQNWNDLIRDTENSGRITSGTINEGMTAVEAELQNLVPGPVSRGAKGDFTDAANQAWDVKSPPSDQFFLKINKAGKENYKAAIENYQLKFDKNINIMLNCTYLNPTHFQMVIDFINKTYPGRLGTSIKLINLNF